MIDVYICSALYESIMSTKFDGKNIFRTVAASTSIPVTLRLAVKGILRDFISFCHFPINMSRNSWLKGPE